MNHIWQKITAILLMCCCAVAMAQQKPDEFVQGVTSQLLDKLVKERKNYKKNPEVLYQIIDESISPYVDYKNISRKVMGQFYRQANDKQRADFEVMFKRGLVRTYGNGLAAYENQKVQVKPAHADDVKSAAVDMDITSEGGKVFPVTYQLTMNDKGQWMLSNMILNGINLGLTFRNQFASQVEQNRGDLDKVIANWVPEVKTAEH